MFLNSIRVIKLLKLMILLLWQVKQGNKYNFVIICFASIEQVLSEQPSGVSPLDEERRATWLETRNLEQNFKELVYLSLQEVG